MDNFFGFIETVLLCLFSYIVPKDKKLILFGSMKGKYIGGNPKAFYLYLQEIYKFDGTLLYYSKNEKSRDGIIKTYGDSMKKYWLLLRAKYLFIDSCSFDLGIHGVFFGKFEVIQMWHGEPIKKIGFLSDLYISRRNKIVLFFEKLEYKSYKYILSNYGSKDIIAGAFLNNRVLSIGLPRNDILIHHSSVPSFQNSSLQTEIEDFRKRFSKIILFSPTFRELNKNPYFIEEQLTRLNEVLSLSDAICIIKLHPNETRAFLSGKKYSNIENVTNKLNYDSTDFLPYIDALITDYSSIYIDFLLTGRPIIWYQNDIEEYLESERGFLYPPQEVFVADTTARSFDQLFNIIKDLNSLTHSESYQSRYSVLKEKFYGKYPESYSACHELEKVLFPIK